MTRTLIVGTPTQSFEDRLGSAILHEQIRGSAVFVETFMQDGEPAARIVSGENLYTSPDNKGFVAFISPEPDPEALMRELMAPAHDDGKVLLYEGEIGVLDCGFRFIPSAELVANYPRITKQKAQWKRERKGRP